MINKTRLLALFIPVIVLFISGCFHRMAPASTEGTYKQNENSMVYTVNPYGSVTLPGKWLAGKYSKATMQQYFYRNDTTTMMVAIGACRSQAYAKGAEGYEFVKRFYEMEARYQTQLLEQTPKVLLEDKDNRYMLWKVHADGIDQYFLCGVKDCTCNECTYRSFTLKNRRLSEPQAIKMLQDIFMDK